MRHVLLAAALLLASVSVASAEGVKGVTRGKNASGLTWERITRKDVTITTYYKNDVQRAQVIRYRSGALHLKGRRYEVFNRTHEGPKGPRVVVDSVKQKARVFQPDKSGKVSVTEPPVLPIEVWSLPGK